VARAHDLAHPAEQSAHPVEDELALDRVALDHLELGLGECGRLVQDLLGDRDLAHVVEHGGELELLTSLEIDAQPVGNLAHEVDDRA